VSPFTPPSSPPPESPAAQQADAVAETQQPQSFAALNNPTTGIVSEDDPSAAGLDEQLDQAIAEEAAINAPTLDEQLDQAIAEEAAINQTIEAEEDWRVRLHLGPSANYLYKDPEAAEGILAPLVATEGIIFPYTPTIAVQYNADYENYDLVHSNYRGYFYKGSVVQNIIVTATFTANDVIEANYMLAAMHFLRSCTKMFYGQDDKNRGMPPPIVFLTGLGEYQFKDHPCAVTMMNYNLPNDVDYIPCGEVPSVAPIASPSGPDDSLPWHRLPEGVMPGGGPKPVATAATTSPYTKATYVPTKIDINFTMIPIQTRDQVSNEFSLKNYASGSLLKKGFW